MSFFPLSKKIWYVIHALAMMINSYFFTERQIHFYRSVADFMIMKKEARLSASLEDYLEVIALIIKEKKVPRAKEIAKRLKVSRASVTEAFRALARKKLINYAPYEVVTLTEKGNAVAEDIILRHRALKEFFLKVLDVEEKIADIGACKIEHAAPGEIIDKMILFVQFLEQCPRGGTDWINSFSTFCSKGRVSDDCQLCISKCLEK